MRNPLCVSAVAAVMLAQSTGCQKATGPDRGTGDTLVAPPAASSQTATVKKRMEAHASETLQIKAALVNGDLARAKQAAGWLAESEWTSNLRKDWRPEMQTMREAARAVVEADDTAHAASALGRIGNACASCHTGVGGPKVADEPAPRSEGDSGMQGVRHLWATDRMWQGLVAPSSEAWLGGAEVLATAPLDPGGRSGVRDVPPKAKLLANRVHELGRVAQAVDADRRAFVFAEVLATCASCHELLRVKVL